MFASVMTIASLFFVCTLAYDSMIGQILEDVEDLLDQTPTQPNDIGH